MTILWHSKIIFFNNFFFVDDEMNLRFGVYGNGDQDGNNNSEGPDLVGITQCIRLVSKLTYNSYKICFIVQIIACKLYTRCVNAGAAPAPVVPQKQWSSLQNRSGSQNFNSRYWTQLDTGTPGIPGATWKAFAAYRFSPSRVFRTNSLNYVIMIPKIRKINDYNI